MSASSVGTVAVLLVGIAVVGIALAVVRRRTETRTRTRERRELAGTLEERLAEALPAGRGTHLETPPRVRRIAVVDGDGSESDADDGDESDAPAIVPVVRVDLETIDPPSEKLRFEYVASALEAIHPILEARGERVHRYDVEFAFGPDGLLVDGECRRVSVPPAVADRLDDESYRAVDLRRAVRRADDDSESPAALWGRCGDESDS